MIASSVRSSNRAWVSCPSLKITIRLPAAPRKSNVRKSCTPRLMAFITSVPWSGKRRYSSGVPMRLMLSRMFS